MASCKSRREKPNLRAVAGYELKTVEAIWMAKDYAKRYALSGLPIVKVGVNFDPEQRNIRGRE